MPLPFSSGYASPTARRRQTSACSTPHETSGRPRRRCFPCFTGSATSTHTTTKNASSAATTTPPASARCGRGRRGTRGWRRRAPLRTFTAPAATTTRASHASAPSKESSNPEGDGAGSTAACGTLWGRRWGTRLGGWWTGRTTCGSRSRSRGSGATSIHARLRLRTSSCTAGGARSTPMWWPSRGRVSRTSRQTIARTWMPAGTGGT
mmetsp:Transcript_1818/g.4476  ORF Transcript_1818/g.4476 Transcript_1818/m.4476 type:complete len:207 (-) Transcript_1818:202-822(-)